MLKEIIRENNGRGNSQILMNRTFSSSFLGTVVSIPASYVGGPGVPET
jgi:hypothetical protein